MSKIQTGYVIAVVSIVLMAFVYFAGIAKANVAFFQSAVTATATSTFAYMTPGTATTTLTFDAGSGYSNTGADLATLMFQYTASNTAPTLKLRVEVSEDNIDWYPQSLPDNSTATTTQPISDYTYTLATSSASISGFGGSGTANRIHESLQISTRTRFTRVVFYDPVSGGNGALWAQIIAKKQNGSN